jgi:hypothetical protein
VQWPLLRVFLVYLALTVAGVVWAFVLEDGNKLRDSSACACSGAGTTSSS